MQLVGKILAVLVVGTALGMFVTWATIVRGGLPGAVSDGPWQTSLATGSAQSDPVTRAKVALHGLFALNRSETIYYSATRDSDGDKLDGACRYSVTGRDPDTRWWSITTYGADDFLIPNPANRYSIAKTSVVRRADGSFAVEVGEKRAAGNWIPVGAGSFSLTLRLYNPGPGIVLDPEHADLPAIRKEACS